MEKAIGSGIASGFPVLIGALAGHTDYGLTASIGALFIYMRAVNRIKARFEVALGFHWDRALI